MKREIKECLIKNLEVGLDPYMKSMGFKRRNHSLIYKRSLGAAIQIIDLEIQIHPRDNPNAAAAVYPIMEVLMPEVDRILQDMIGGDIALLEGITGGTSRQPIDFTSEKEQLGRWFIYQSDSVVEAVKNVQKFIERWTMPFLDGYTTPQDVVATDERDDGRMVRDRAQMMRVVAAAIVCGRRDYAQALMDKRLGSVGARRLYHKIFEYIQGIR